jgi:hypothetical protein
MILSTLCYIEKDGKYLRLHRTKKKKDINKDKWLGIGGKFEKNESPEECIIREVKEETGLILQSYKLRCIVTYVSTTLEGDKIFVEKIKNDNTFFTVKFEYDGEKLIKYSLKEY